VFKDKNKKITEPYNFTFLSFCKKKMEKYQIIYANLHAPRA